MADPSNNISAVADILIAEAQPVLRESATTARRVTTEYRDEAAMRNQKITVPIPSPKTAEDITDPYVLPLPNDVQPFAVDVVLDKWKLSQFTLTDREQMEMKPGYFPSEAEESLKAVINVVDKDILATSLHSPFFATLSSSPVWPDIPNLNQLLFDNLVPVQSGDVSVFIDGATQAGLQKMDEFVHFNLTGETEGLRRGSLGERLALQFFANQNVGTHTTGAMATATITGAETAAIAEDQSFAFGAGTDPLVGDIVNIVGSGDHAVIAVGGGSMTVRPALRGDTGAGAAITYATSQGVVFDTAAVHGLNYAFHRRAIAFASRPLSTIETPGTVIRSVADPISGIVVRLEIRRKGKTNTFEWDILYGAKLVRPELTARWNRIVS